MVLNNCLNKIIEKYWYSIFVRIPDNAPSQTMPFILATLFMGIFQGGKMGGRELYVVEKDGRGIVIGRKRQEGNCLGGKKTGGDLSVVA